MTTKQNKKTGISAYNIPWRVIGCLAAAGCALLCYREQAARVSSAFLIRESVGLYFIAGIVIAVMNLIIPRKLMFLAAVPILYVLGSRIVNLYLLFGSTWYYEAILIGCAALVVLSAAAYRFDSKKTPFVLLFLLFGTKISYLAYDIILTLVNNEFNFDKIGADAKWELSATFLLFTSIATTTYVIANGKNKGVPKKGITGLASNQQNSTYDDEIQLTDIIPYIDGDVIQIIADNVGIESTDVVDYGDIRRGLYVMDTLAQNGPEIRGGGYRAAIIGIWLDVQYHALMKKMISYKIFSKLIWIAGIAAIIAIVFFMDLISGLGTADLINLGLVFAIAIIPFFIIRGSCVSIFKNFLKRPGNPVWRECVSKPEIYFCQYAYSKEYTGVESISGYLDKICESLNLDSSAFKVDLGRQTGGYSTFYHVGSGGVSFTGTDAVFGILSRVIAGSRNNAVNARIKRLESLLYYNNVVVHFYEHIIPNQSLSLLKVFVDGANAGGDGDEITYTDEITSAPVYENYTPAPVHNPNAENTGTSAVQPAVMLQKNTIALVGFIFSMVGVVSVFPLCGILGVPGFICSLIGLVRSGSYERKRYRGLAVAGIVVGLLMTAFFVFMMYYIANQMGSRVKFW